MNKQRLLDVARALRETPHPEKFDMGKYAHPCGTPACALGNYAARSDLQDHFRIHMDAEYSAMWISTSDNKRADYFRGDVLEWFGITDEQAEELFSTYGCGGVDECDCGGEDCDRCDGDGCDNVIVTDPIKAAEYIEEFCRSHEVQP